MGALASCMSEFGICCFAGTQGYLVSCSSLLIRHLSSSRNAFATDLGRVLFFLFGYPWSFWFLHRSTFVRGVSGTQRMFHISSIRTMLYCRVVALYLGC